MTDSYDLIVKLRAVREFRRRPSATKTWPPSSKQRDGRAAQEQPGLVIQSSPASGSRVSPSTVTTPTRSGLGRDHRPRQGGRREPLRHRRVAQNIMLAAKTIGVASCPITLHRSAQAREFLGAPEGTETRYAVAGYPTAGARPSRFGGRKPTEAVVRYERY